MRAKQLLSPLNAYEYIAKALYTHTNLGHNFFNFMAIF